MNDRPTWFGLVPVPELSTAVWTVVITSVAAYFLFDRAAANLAAIIGAIVVTVVAFTRYKAEMSAGDGSDR